MNNMNILHSSLHNAMMIPETCSVQNTATSVGNAEMSKSRSLLLHGAIVK